MRMKKMMALLAKCYRRVLVLRYLRNQYEIIIISVFLCSANKGVSRLLS